MAQNIKKVPPPFQPNVWQLVIDIDPQILAQISAGDTVIVQFRAPNGNLSPSRQISNTDLIYLLGPPPQAQNGP